MGTYSLHHTMAATAPSTRTARCSSAAMQTWSRSAARTERQVYALAPGQSRGKTSREQATERFSNIAEAFDVLTTPRRGRSTSKALLRSAKTTRSRRTSERFRELLGTGNPVQRAARKGPTVPIRAAANPPAQVVQLTCTPELYCGCIKRPTASRMVATDGIDVKPEDVKLDVVIKPGYAEGTKITFRGEGDRLPG